jgi:hypothetical protein
VDQPISTEARFMVSVSEALIASPFSVAPPPRIARYVSSSAGAWMTPTMGRRSTTKPMEMHQLRSPWAKLAVPSMGSMIQT